MTNKVNKQNTPRLLRNVNIKLKEKKNMRIT